MVLEFLHKGKVYRITRNPGYERPKKNGDGTTMQLAEAHLELGDELLANGVKDVDNKVREILGIDVKQFKQISMLAQGEFLKILFAESKDRTEIFRKIFDTNIYQNITKRLKYKQDEAENNLNNYKTSFLTNTNNIVWKEKPEFLSSLDNKNVHNYIKDILELLEKEIETNKNDMRIADENVAKLYKDLSEKEKNITKLEEQNKKIEKYESLQKQQQELFAQKEDFKNKQEQIDITQKIQAIVLPKQQIMKKTQTEIENLQKNIIENEKTLKILAEKEEEYKKKDIIINEIKLKFQEYQNQKNEQDKLREEIVQIDNILKIIADCEALKIELSSTKEKEEKILTLKKLLEQYKILNEEFEKTKLEKTKVNEIKIAVKEYEENLKKYDVVNKKYREIEDSYILEEKKFFREQAGILAETLEENSPCPVCGSIHHPNIAEKSDALSKDELDELKSQKEKIEKEKNQAGEKVTVSKTKFDTLNSELNYDKKTQSLNEYVKNINEVFDTKQVNIKNKKAEIEKLYFEIRGENAEVENINFEELKEKFDENKKSVENKITKANTLIENFTKNMKKEFSSQNSINEYSSDVKTKFEVLKKMIFEKIQTLKNLYYEIEKKDLDIDEFNFDEFKENYEDSKKAHSKQITEKNTQKTEYTKTLQNKNSEFAKAKTEYENAYKELGFETEELYKKNFLQEKDVKNLQEEIKKFNEECVKIKTQINELKEEVAEKEKVDLTNEKEEFVSQKEELEKLKETQISAKANYDLNSRVHVALNEDSREFIKQKDVFVLYEELYKTASGNLSGKRKIEFEQYVQAAYFDMILVQANKRLVKMTGNRFELVRKENSAKLNEKIGLDLEVIDNYTGKRRDVKSLSGGESFKAALSLSLGVSDVIQSYSGRSCC